MNPNQRAPKASLNILNHRYILAGIVLGILVSVAVRFSGESEQCQTIDMSGDFSFTSDKTLHNGVSDDDLEDQGQNQKVKEKEFMLVGIMTARKFLRTRAVAVYRTWAKMIPGRVVFFSSEGAENEATDIDLPIVGLKGVTDVYPPMSKAFMMLKYMYDNYLEKFEWFVRADDDVYMRMDELVAWLRSINSSYPQYIGQAGIGSVEDLGKLYFAPDDNFCMGGGGYIMSQQTVRQVSPKISTCLKNLYSRHDDVEIGRCVKYYVGIPCTWAFEMEKIFLQNYYDLTFAHPLDDPVMDTALTLHSIKNISYMYRLHSFYAARAHSAASHKMLLLTDESRLMSKLAEAPKKVDPRNAMIRARSPFAGFKAKKIHEVTSWDFIDRRVFTSNSLRLVSGYVSREKDALDTLVRYVETHMNKNASRTLISKHVNNVPYAMRRIEPTIGVDYVLGLEVMHEAFEDPKQTNEWTKSQVRVRQPFRQLEFREILDADSGAVENVDHLLGISNSDVMAAMPNMNRNSRSMSISKRTILLFSDMLRTPRVSTLHFVVRLSGSLAHFEAFMRKLDRAVARETDVAVFAFVEDTSAKHSNVQQLIAFMKSMEDNNTKYFFNVDLQRDFPTVVDCLQRASQLADYDALLVVADEDVRFTRDGIRRLKANTVQSRQVYFPITYSPHWCKFDEDNCFKASNFRRKQGTWCSHEFNVFAMYNSDFQAVADAMNATSVHASTDKQLTLLEHLLVFENVTVFRAPDRGILRVFAPTTEPTPCLKGNVHCYEAFHRLSIGELAERVLAIPPIVMGGDD